MTAPRDPLGRRALFGPPPGPPASEPPASGRAAATGRRAFFTERPERRKSPAVPPSATVTVLCRSCRVTSELEPGSALRRLVGTLWWPLGAWNHRMRCPACTEVGWCRVQWDGLIDWR